MVNQPPLAIPQFPTFQLPTTVPNAAPQQIVQPAASDWRTRAEAVQPETPAPQATQSQPKVADWRSRAEVVAQPKQNGEDQGRGVAAVQGFNSAVPFGERIAAGLGAGLGYAYEKTKDAITGEDNNLNLNDYYLNARENQQATRDAHGGAYTAGAITGIAAQLPMLSAKVIGGGAAATTGVRGTINAIPEALGAVGNYVRGSKVAAEAGTLAKAANLTGKAVRSAAVAAPTAGLYSYGSSEHGLDTQGALDDAKSGARVGAALGAALPVAGAAVGGVLVPKLSKEIGALAKRAKDFGMDLSLNQISPGNVRNTVQKISQNVPFSGVEKFESKQAQQWHKAVAKEIGQDTDNLGPETIKKFLTENGAKFDNAIQNKPINVGYDGVTQIDKIVADAAENITGDYASIVAKKAEKLTQELYKTRTTANGITYAANRINGEKLSSIRSQLIKDLPKVAGDAREYVGELVSVIDDIAASNLSKEARAELALARNQWRNYKTLQPLLEKSVDGTINPAQLMQRIASNKFITASKQGIGEDNLVDLARIGKQFLTKQGGSDTAQKLAYMKGASNVGALGAGYVAPVEATAAVLANRGYQSVNRSQTLVNKAINKATGEVSGKAAPMGNIADMLESGDESLMFGGKTHQFIDGEISKQEFISGISKEVGAKQAAKIADEVERVSGAGAQEVATSIADRLDSGDESLLFGGKTTQFIDGEMSKKTYINKITPEVGREEATRIANEVEAYSNGTGKSVADMLDNGDEELWFDGNTQKFIDGKLTKKEFINKLVKSGTPKDKAATMADEIEKYHNN